MTGGGTSLAVQRRHDHRQGALAAVGNRPGYSCGTLFDDPGGDCPGSFVCGEGALEGISRNHESWSEGGIHMLAQFHLPMPESHFSCG